MATRLEALDRLARTATKWTIREASFVRVPVDRNARARSQTGSMLPLSDRASVNQQIRGEGKPARRDLSKGDKAWDMRFCIPTLIHRDGVRREKQEKLLDLVGHD